MSLSFLNEIFIDYIIGIPRCFHLRNIKNSKNLFVEFFSRQAGPFSAKKIQATNSFEQMGEVVVGFFEHHRIGFACGDAWKKNKNVPQMVVKNADLP